MGHISASALLPWFLRTTIPAAFHPPWQVKSYINYYVPENPTLHHQIPYSLCSTI